MPTKRQAVAQGGRSHRHRRRVRSSFRVPVYRDSFFRCPRCRTELEAAGRARGCRGCRGVWIEEATLIEMVRAMHNGAETAGLQFHDRAGDGLPCPSCGDGMAPVTLETIDVDRCGTHGVWFDADELEGALHRAGLRPPRVVAAEPGDLERAFREAGLRTAREDSKLGWGDLVEAIVMAVGGLLP